MGKYRTRKHRAIRKTARTRGKTKLRSRNKKRNTRCSNSVKRKKITKYNKRQRGGEGWRELDWLAHSAQIRQKNMERAMEQDEKDKISRSYPSTEFTFDSGFKREHLKDFQQYVVGGMRQWSDEALEKINDEVALLKDGEGKPAAGAQRELEELRGKLHDLEHPKTWWIAANRDCRLALEEEQRRLEGIKTTHAAELAEKEAAYAAELAEKEADAEQAQEEKGEIRTKHEAEVERRVGVEKSHREAQEKAKSQRQALADLKTKVREGEALSQAVEEFGGYDSAMTLFRSYFEEKGVDVTAHYKVYSDEIFPNSDIRLQIVGDGEPMVMINRKLSREAALKKPKRQKDKAILIHFSMLKEIHFQRGQDERTGNLVLKTREKVRGYDHLTIEFKSPNSSRVTVSGSVHTGFPFDNARRIFIEALDHIDDELIDTMEITGLS